MTTQYTEFELLCDSMVNKRVKVTFKDGGTPFIGKCIGYTRGIDDDDGKASVDVDTESACYNLYEDEILKIIEV